MPSVFIVRRKIMPSLQSMSYSDNIWDAVVGMVSNSATTDALSQPWRINPMSDRAPSANDSASINMLFPAPVSPVKMFSPAPNVKFSFSINTMFEMCNPINIVGLLRKWPEFSSFYLIFSNVKSCVHKI